MKRKLAPVVCMSAALAVMASPAGAAAPTDPPKCFGQTVAGLTYTYGSAKAAADAFGVSVKDGRQLVIDFCENGGPT